MNEHLHPLIRTALNAHLLDDDPPEPEPGFWRCKCGTEVPEVWAYCDKCGAPHPYAHGGPEDAPETEVNHGD
jgi:hypothetical protein